MQLTGTATVTNGSPTVTSAAGADFAAAKTARDAGDPVDLILANVIGALLYEVASIAYNAGTTVYTITLSSNFVGTTGSTTIALHTDYHPNGTPMFNPPDKQVQPLLNRIGALLDGLLTLPVASAREFHVDNYGAKGDGSTDDRAAIQAAVDAAIASTTGGNVVFSSGKPYRINAQPNTVAAAATSISLTGLAGTDKLRIVGNGAVLKITSASGAVFGVSSYFDVITVENLTFDRANSVHQYPTMALWIDDSYGAAASWNPTAVIMKDCSFINMDRAGSTTDGGKFARVGRLKYFIFKGNRISQPWGTNSGDLSGRPLVSVITANVVDTAIFQDNDWDGGSNIVGAHNPNGLNKHGFFIHEGRCTVALNNRVKNFSVEGMFSAPQGTLALNSSGFTMPAIGADVTVPFVALAENLPLITVGMTLFVLNSSNPYLYGLMEVRSPITSSLILRNTGAAANAAGGTSFGAYSLLNKVDPWAGTALHIYQGNEIDQAAPAGATYNRSSPCIATYHGTAFIQKNILRHVAVGIGVGGLGATIAQGYPNEGNDSVISVNAIELDAWGTTTFNGRARGITVKSEALRAHVIGNVITAPTSKGIIGVSNGKDGITSGNIVRAAALAYDASYLSWAYEISNGSSGQSLINNHAENVDQGIEFQTEGGGAFKYSGLSCVNVKTPLNEYQENDRSLGNDPINIVFTPTATGWHRIIIGSGTIHGRLKMWAEDANGLFSCFLYFSLAGYGVGSALNQPSGFLFNTPPVNQARVSSSGDACYLDVNVTSSTTPKATITVSLDTPVKARTLYAPTASAAVGTDAGTVKTLTFATGIVTVP